MITAPAFGAQSACLVGLRISDGNVHIQASRSTWFQCRKKISLVISVESSEDVLEGDVSGWTATLWELSDALKRLSLFSMQKYRTRYLLARLTQHVDMAFSGTKLRGSLASYAALEIEHILPDTPTDDLRANWATENPIAIYDDYKNRLGNLTLLEKPINIVVGNNYYSAKQAEYRKSSNYLTRSLAELTNVGQNTSITRINEKLESFVNWNPSTIDRRHGLLASLAQDVWKTTPIEV